MTRPLIGLITLALLGACSPAERINPTDDRPSLAIADAVSGSRLFVDGLDTGLVGDPLLLEAGTHMVKVVGPAGGIYSEKVFLSGRGTRTLTVPAGAAP
ncbi:MAG: hypothetical protein EPN20_14920 [Magnetospirillum sp.]|nr:MAG: hypothetical protein EPN20_14920 [Magnetospirillum sp.]